MKRYILLLVFFLWYSNTYSSTYILKNGLKIITNWSDFSDAVSITVLSTGGLIDEDEGNASISSIVQGAIFCGTKKRNTKTLKKNIAEVGIKIEKGIELDHSYIIFTSSKKNFYLMLDIVTDVIFYPIFEESEIKKQKELLIEDIKSKEKNYIQDAYFTALGEIYKKSRLLFGEYPSEETILKIDRPAIVAWHRKFYSPPNIIISVSGNFDREFFEKKIQQLQTIQPVEKHTPIVPQDINCTDISFKKNINLPLLMFFLGDFQGDFLATVGIQIISYLIETGKIDIVHNLVSKLSLAFYIGTNFTYNRFIIYAISPPSNLEKVSSALLWEIAKIKQKEISEDVLNEVKDYIMSSYYIQIQESSLHSYKMALEEFIKNGKNLEENYIEILQNISSEQIKNIAQRYLKNFCTIKVLSE